MLPPGHNKPKFNNTEVIIREKYKGEFKECACLMFNADKCFIFGSWQSLGNTLLAEYTKQYFRIKWVSKSWQRKICQLWLRQHFQEENLIEKGTTKGNLYEYYKQEITHIAYPNFYDILDNRIIAGYNHMTYYLTVVWLSMKN